MEFIKAEEFLGQPVEVQKVFLEWWKPNVGDLFAYRNTNSKSFGVLFNDGEIENYKYNKGNDDFATFKIKSIPLLSEGQLRQFIEDNCLKIEMKLHEDGEYTLKTFLHGCSYIMIDDNSLLQAYWKVAIEIAKEAKV